jgi:hypothetical protein
MLGSYNNERSSDRRLSPGVLDYLLVCQIIIIIQQVAVRSQLLVGFDESMIRVAHDRPSHSTRFE